MLERKESEGLKLVLNDDAPVPRQEERRDSGESSNMRSTLKRILVSKESKEV